MDPFTHLDVEPTGDLSPEQHGILKNTLLSLSEKPEFEGVSFYLNGEYIGGRRDDRG
jgi:hypothetical protein